MAGAVEIIDTTFTVTSGPAPTTPTIAPTTPTTPTTPTAPPAGNGTLKVTTAANRSASVALQGWPGTGRTQAFIFLETSQAFTKVVSSVDNRVVRTEAWRRGISAWHLVVDAERHIGYGTNDCSQAAVDRFPAGLKAPDRPERR